MKYFVTKIYWSQTDEETVIILAESSNDALQELRFRFGCFARIDIPILARLI